MFNVSKCSMWMLLLCGGNALAACGATPNSPDVDAEEGVALQSAALCKGKPRNIGIPSNTRWNSYSNATGSSVSLGKAELVCLNASSPADCPVEAIDYGYPGAGWTAQIDACDGNARWIWAPGITGASAPAELAEYTFKKDLLVPAHATTAFVHIVADDFAEVIVNGTVVGSVGSTTVASLSSASQAAATDIDIAAALVPGTNTIAIRAVNGPSAFAGCSNCTYQQNPAGVAFCVDIQY
jgi:hypothetical protein